METKITISLLALVSLILTLSAALPEKWDVDLAAQPPQVFALQRPRGETYALEAVLKNRGKPFAPAVTNVCIFWQTNGMESTYWSAPASVSNNVLRATWLPSMDPGATTVRGYIGDPGHIYAAAFQFRFTSSPGAVPNIIDVPPRVLDLAHTVVINPPWPTDATIDASIRRVIDEDGITAPVPTNVVKGIISNTVDKAYVESLGISGGGGSGGTNTNDVKAIVDAEVGGTNAVKQAVADVALIKSDYTTSNAVERIANRAAETNATVAAKRDMTNMDVEINVPGTDWEITYNPSGYSGYLRVAWEIDPTGETDIYGWIINTEDYVSNILSTDPNAKSLMETSFWLWSPGLGVSRTVAHVEHDRLATTNGVEKAVANKADRSELQSIANSADEAKTAANDANVWSMANYNFMTGGRTNCWFSGTNYVFGTDAATRTRFAWEDGMDAATVPCSMELWEIRDGVRQLVWDQRDWTAWYWSFKAAQMTADIQGRIDALGDAVTNAANYAWSKRYASDGTPNPDASTTFIDTPSVTLSPGMKWETVATVSGAAYWTIVGNGAVIGGSGTNATLRIQDFEGNDIMTITKGENKLVWLEKGDFSGNMVDDDGWVCFDIIADENADPVGYFSTTLDLSDFIQQTDPNIPAQYRWEYLHNGKWRIHYILKPGVQASSCFLMVKVRVNAQTVIRYNAGQEISGGLIYNGVKIAPDVSGSPAAGTVIQWKVVR